MNHCDRKRQAWKLRHGDDFLAVVENALLTRPQQAERLNEYGIPTITGKVGIWKVSNVLATYKRIYEDE